MMAWELSDEHEMLRRRCASSPRPRSRPHAAQWDRDHHFPVDVVRAMGDLGLFGIVFPEQYGGAGGDFASLCVAIEELGRVDQSMGITLSAGVGLGANPIYRFGNDDQQAEWLPDLVAGRALGGFGLTEPDGGSDAGATRTQAVLDDGEWVINGSKAFITNCGTSITSLTTVTARTDDGISAFVVPAGTPGFIVEPAYHKLGWHASDTHGITLDDCRVPEAQPARQAGRRVPQLPRDPRRRADRDLGAGARVCPGGARDRGRVRQAAQRLRRADRPLPGSRLPALGPRREGRERPQPHVQGGVAEGPGPPDRAGGGDGQAVLDRGRRRRGAGRHAGARRARVHRGVARSRGSTATPRSSRSARARARSSGS